MSDSSLPDLCPYCGSDKSNRRSSYSGVADTTTRIDQVPNGCWVACIASLTDVPHEELIACMPEVVGGDFDEQSAPYHNAVNKLLRSRGWRLLRSGADCPRGFAMAYGTSPRGVEHAVIVKDGQLWHDPHSSRAGLVTITQYEIIVPLISSPEMRDGGWRVEPNPQGTAAEVFFPTEAEVAEVTDEEVVEMFDRDGLAEAEAYIAKLRGPLLHFFGTTDPELLAEVWRDQFAPSPATSAVEKSSCDSETPRETNDAALIHMIAKHQLAVAPQVGGGWVITTSEATGGGDYEVAEIVRTRESLHLALRLAQDILEPQSQPPSPERTTLCASQSPRFADLTCTLEEGHATIWCGSSLNGYRNRWERPKASSRSSARTQP